MKRVERSNRHLVLATFFAIACQKLPDAPDAAAPGQTAPSRTHSAERGNLSGHIRTNAKPHEPVSLPESVKRVCGETLNDQTLLIGEGGALQNAVVFIDDAPDAPAPEGRALLIDQKRCAYNPSLIVGHTGEWLTVRNSDPLVHNVRAQAKSGELFNVAMPIENLTLKRMLPMTAGQVHVGCDVHPWMRSDVYVLPHNTWALTDATGAYTLPGVEAGTRPVHVWHAVLGEKKLTVDVPANGLATLDSEI